MTVDPVVEATQQPYGYSGQDPVNEVDLQGTCCGVLPPNPCISNPSTPGCSPHQVSTLRKEWRQALFATGFVAIPLIPAGAMASSFAIFRVAVAVTVRLGAASGTTVATIKAGTDTWNKTTAGPWFPRLVGSAFTAIADKAPSVVSAAPRAQRIARLAYVIWQAARHYGR